jgi:ribosome recycling factor
MSDENVDLSNVELKMKNALVALAKDFSGIRTNRASAELLDIIRVEVYGGVVPVEQVGSVSVPDPKTIVVQVWDKNAVKAVERAIRESDLGLNPSVDGQMVRISLPPLSEERRKELVKVAARCAEEAKVSVRNSRRDAIEQAKKQEKAKEISEDDLHHLTDAVQKITDKYINEIDAVLKAKQGDIMSLAQKQK